MYRFWALVLTGFLGVMRVSAQDKGTPQLYTGMVDGKIAVTMFLYITTNECSGDPEYQGIYRYDKNPGTDDWLLLEINNNAQQQFVMVETDFTGVMVLQKSGDTYSGIWIHPDGKKQLKVVFKKQPLPKAQVEKYLEFLENTNHRYHDC